MGCDLEWSQVDWKAAKRRVKNGKPPRILFVAMS
jgi:hypothetical protein